MEQAPGGGSELDAVLAAALRAIPPAVVVFDADGRPWWANASMHQLLAQGDGDAVALERAFDPDAPVPDVTLGQALLEAASGTPTRLEQVPVATAGGMIEREAWVGPVRAGDGSACAVLVLPAEEERLHPLLANTYDIISVLAADGTIRYSNPAAGKLMAYEGTVLAGSSATDLVHPDDRDQVAEVLADPSHAVGEPLRLRLRFGDGEWHHCLVHIADLLDDPAVGGIVVTVHDVTEQVAAHDELRRSEEWVRRLLAQLTDVIVVYDADGQVTYVSPSIEGLVGTPESAHPGTDVFETIHPDDLATVEQALATVLEDPDTEQRVTFRLRHADGHYVWVEAVTTNGLADPAVQGIIATLRDITQLKQAEEMFRGLVESAPDAMVVVDDIGSIVLANERAEHLFGWSADELIGRSVDLLVPEQLRNRHAAHRADFATAPRTRVMGEGIELLALRRDGSHVPVEVSLSPHDTHQGRLTSAAIRDITVQRETHRALESALRGEQEVVKRLEEADALKAEFVSTVAHELKSPLTAISGFAQVLERSLDDEEVDSSNAAMMAGRISANAARLLEMIEQLLRFSRLEAGRAPLRQDHVELRTVVERSGDLLRTAFEDHRLEIDIPAGLTVWTDEDGIANVVRNLLGNAAKFGPPGSTIRIDATASDDGVTVAVSDEGPGVPPEERDTVFEQFHQTDDGRRRGGTGLGLSIARRYVELHDGRIWVEEAAGGGARFVFWLPHPG